MSKMVNALSPAWSPNSIAAHGVSKLGGVSSCAFGRASGGGGGGGGEGMPPWCMYLYLVLFVCLWLCDYGVDYVITRWEGEGSKRGAGV